MYRALVILFSNITVFICFSFPLLIWRKTEESNPTPVKRTWFSRPVAAPTPLHHLPLFFCFVFHSKPRASKCTQQWWYQHPVILCVIDHSNTGCCSASSGPETCFPHAVVLYWFQIISVNDISKEHSKKCYKIFPHKCFLVGATDWIWTSGFRDLQSRALGRSATVAWLVRVERFELPTLWSQTRCANQTALHTDKKLDNKSKGPTPALSSRYYFLSKEGSWVLSTST